MSLTSTVRTLSATDKSMIDDFIARKGIEVLPPAGLTGNEATRATNELIARKRREYRAKKRAEQKAATGN